MPGFRIVGTLDGDGSGFERMLGRAQAKVGAFASGPITELKGMIAGAFTIGAITALSKKTIDLASHLRDVSDALAVNVEWFQKRANAAKLAGGSEEDLMKFIDTMNKSRENAVNHPGKEMSQRFARLGFSGAEVSGLNTMDFFDKLVKAYGNGANQQSTVDVEHVGGKSARNLIAAFANQFQSDTPILSEYLVNELDDIGDEFTVLGRTILVEFAPALLRVLKIIREFLNDAAIVGKVVKAGASQGTGKDWLSFFMNSGAGGKTAGNPKSGGGFFDRVVAAALLTGFDEIVKDMARDDAMKSAKEKERAARRRRENGPPGFEPLDLEKQKRGPKIETDNLVGIGNFLGRSGGLVNTVAEQQLQVAKEHVRISYLELAALQNIGLLLAVKQGADLAGVNVPPT